MFKNATVRNKILLVNSSEHSSLSFGSQDPMMRETNITEIINSASISFENYFLWVHIKMQLLEQKICYFTETVNQKLSIRMNENKIIGIPYVSDDFQVVLNELIHLVKVNVCKQLRG